MKRSISLLLVLVAAFLCTACGKTPEPQETVDKSQPDPPIRTASENGTDTPKTEKGDGPSLSDPNALSSNTEPKLDVDDNSQKPAKVEPPIPPRTSVAGKWLFVMNRGTNEVTAFLFDIIEAADKSFTLKLLDTQQNILDTKVKQFNIDATSVQFTLSISESEADFEGALEDGAILGNLVFDQEQTSAVRLVATRAEDMAAYQQPHDAPERDEFIEAVTGENKAEGAKKFSIDHPQSMLAFLAFEEALGMVKEESLDHAAVESLADSYFKFADRWGKRMQIFAHINAATRLSKIQFDPKLTLQYVTFAENMMTEPQATAWKSMIDLPKGLSLIWGDNADGQEQGAGLLRALHDDQPLGTAMITNVLAEYAEKKGQTDQAMELYAEISVLPQLEQILMSELSQQGGELTLPSENVARLWKKKHGNTQGLDHFLDEVFAKSIVTFAVEPVKPRQPDAGNKVVLCELFTGAQCPPCVAADVATIGLEATYSKTEVIVLRYHQHIPLDDPLANPDTEERLFFYNLTGTPTICLNGRQVSANVGGNYFQSEAVYDELKSLIDLELEKKSKVILTVSAKAAEGKLLVSATVDGLTEVSDKHRLRLVLAEDAVSFPARNEIRHHEMIVRALIGGIDGISPKDGKLAHTETIDLGKFRQKLVDYLAKYEAGRRTQFALKPLELQKLHLIAFVQDDTTRSILQTIAIPVEGKLEYPAAAKPAEPKPAEPKDADKPKTEKPKTEKKPADAPKSADSPKPTNSTKPDAKPSTAKKPADKKPAEKKADGPKLKAPATKTE